MPFVNLDIVKKADVARRVAGRYAPDAILSAQQKVGALGGRASNAANQVLAAVPGASELLGTVTFSDVLNLIGRGIDASGINKGVIKCGWAPDNIPLSGAYKIHIENTRPVNYDITAIMQDSVKFNATSDWRSFNELIPHAQEISTATQLLMGKSPLTGLGSRRIWMGTSPLKMTIPLRFEAVNDAYIEVVVPTMHLQQLVMPERRSGEEGAGIFGQFLKNVNIPLLSPPGPNPLKIGQSKFDETIAAGDDITIKIGTLWQFSQVIVREVEVEYPTKYTDEGHPISATVMMTFETYEIMTKESLQKAYHGGKVT